MSTIERIKVTLPTSATPSRRIKVVPSAPARRVVVFYGQSPTVGGMPTGGTNGALIEKQSSTNFDSAWTNTLENSNLIIDGGLL